MKTTIKNRSPKRRVQELEYKAIKERKKEFMIERKFWKCLLCGTKLDPEDDTVQWHHLTGRNGHYLMEFGNIVPVHPLCHSDLHHRDINYLKNTKWYPHLLTRLKEGAMKNGELKNVYFAKAHNKELRRLVKAGFYDQEMFLKEFINEE